MSSRAARRQAQITVLYDEYGAYARQLATSEARELAHGGTIEPRMVKRAGGEDLVQSGWQLRDKHNASKHESAPSLTVRDVYLNAGVVVHLRRGVPTRHNSDHGNGREVQAVQRRVTDWNRLTHELRAEITRKVTPEQLAAL